MMKQKYQATLFAILAAALYALNMPLSKNLLNHVEPTMMAAFLYLGAGFGLFLYGLITKNIDHGEPLTKKRTSLYNWWRNWSVKNMYVFLKKGSYRRSSSFCLG